MGEMQQKLQCLQLLLANRKGPILHDKPSSVIQPMLRKWKELGCEVLPHLPFSPDLLPTNYVFFKHPGNFLQGKHFHNQEEAENAFQEFFKS